MAPQASKVGKRPQLGKRSHPGHGSQSVQESQSLQGSPSVQGSQSSGPSRRIWTYLEVSKLVDAMKEMAQSGIYKSENGFKPGYLNFLEDKLKVSCPNSGIKARPHIESHFKTLKKDWTTVHEILTGARHGSSGFGFDSVNNMIVAPNDVWDDYVKHFPEAAKWRNKHFRWYEDCCIVFGNDRATGEDARGPADMMAEATEVASSGSDSGGPDGVDIEYSSGSKRSRSDFAEMSSCRRRRRSSDPNTYIGDSMVRAAQIMVDQLAKSQIGIAKAILDDKDRRKVVLSAMEEVIGLPVVDRAMYASKVMVAPELMDGFLSLEPEYRLAWLQRMFPGIM